MSDPKPPVVPDGYKAALPTSPHAQTELQTFLLDATAGNLQMLNRQVAVIGSLLAEIKGLLEEQKSKGNIIVP